MSREWCIVTIVAAIFLSWFVFRKSLNKNDKNRKNTGIPPSTPTSSTAADLAGKFEVFLSFRGTDTREGFTDFLYTYLVDAGIRTFRDDNELRIGEEIGPDLLKAINDSKISIPIFSKNYAFSKSCLRELAQMVKCQKNEGQKIFPIFYDVDASDVRNQKGYYKKAFQQHEKNFDRKTVQEWREALENVGQLKGYELKKETNGHEGELVKKVVRNVLLQLKKNYTHVPRDLLGMDNHVQEMTRLGLDSDSVRIVGIHGMGGIGKTTIAKVIYNQLCESFELCCFLEDVREKAKQHHRGLVDLQNQLVSQILKINPVDIVNVDDGMYRIKDALHKNKVLIVLDDVDEKSQFDKLTGEYDWLHKGSKIIVTTRNKEVLNALEMSHRKKGLFEAYRSYEPELMNPELSLQLFSKSAFMRDSPPEDYSTLSKEVVSTAAGLPLVLVTLGSLFFGKEDKDLWREKLKELKKIPNEDILGKLRISFEALNDHQKCMFLDIACLFIGEDKTNPYYMWDDCGFYPRNGIDTLVLRSLVRIGDGNKLMMHDQLRDLGRQIARGGILNKPEKYSRVWCPEEALDVLTGGLGTKNVEALKLDPRPIKKGEYEQLELVGEVYELAEFIEPRFYAPLKTKAFIRRFEGQDFSQLPNLRFLQLGFVFLDGDFKHLFSNLRWLKWRCCEKYIPINLSMKNLVILDLSNSTITDEWEGWTLFKAAKKLKVLNLSRCRGLIRGPNLSMFTSLEILNLRDAGLIETNRSFGNLTRLRDLDLSYCKLLKLDCSTFKDLESLNLYFCESLLEVSGLEMSKSLAYLETSNCVSLRTLGNLSNLKKLKELRLYYCSSLTEIQGLENLEYVEILDIKYCESMERLPGPLNLRMLKELSLYECKNLLEVGGLRGLESLERLDMTDCKSLKRLPVLSNLGKLKTLDLTNCWRLFKIEGLGDLVSLEFLNMTWCMSIVRLPDLSKLRMLKELLLKDCRKLCEVVGLGGLESLEHLDMTLCERIDILPDLSNLKKLKKISLDSLFELREITGYSSLVLLESLDISSCKLLPLKSLDFSYFKNLKELYAHGLDHWTEIRGLEELKSLEVLNISFCSSLEKLPDFSNFKSLRRLDARGCKKLHEIQGLEELKNQHCLITVSSCS